MLSPRALLALAILTVSWGLNWPIMKLSLRELSPIHFRALTMTGGVLLLALFYRSRGVRLEMSRADLPRVLLLALPNIVGWHLLSIFGVQALASGRAAILGFTMPAITALLSAAVFREPMTRRLWAGTGLATAAVGLLVANELGHMAGRPQGIAWMLAAATSWAIGTILLRRVQVGLSTEALTVWMMGLACPLLWSLAIGLEPAPSWRFSTTMWLALAWGAAVNYGFAQIIWFGIARSLPPAASALSIMAVPLIGLGGSLFITSERPLAADYVAAALIVAALATVLLHRPARA